MMMTQYGYRAATPAVIGLLVILSFNTLAAAHEIQHESLAMPQPSATATIEEVQSLINDFRETGADQYLDKAWVRLQPALAVAPTATTLVQAATVAQARHEFSDALRRIDEALEMQPGFDQAWLLRASIELVRGQTERASESCHQLRNVPALVSVTCRARVAIARGDGRHALKRLSAVLDTINFATANPDALAWALSVSGDAAAAFDAPAAIRFYTRSLETRESTQVRAALVDQLLQADRLEDARSVLAAGHDALPLLIRRFIVARRLGSIDDASAAISRADHQFRHWIADDDFAHAREMARFYLDVLERPTLARRLAAINLELQKEPEDILLAQRAGV